MDKILWAILIWGFAGGAIAQQDFSIIYRNTDPAADSLGPDEKINLHTAFLEKAQTQNDTFNAILGNLYLSNDYVIKTDYTVAMRHLIEAGNLSAELRDTLLLGRVNHKKGAIYSYLQNYPEAIEFYQTALYQSTIAGDSIYIAISLEQLGRRFANMGDYQRSNEYYRMAIPMVEEFCKPHSLSTTLINYGNSLDEQDSVEKAIKVYKRAIQIGERIKDDYEIVPAKQNLALVYAMNGRLDKALGLYRECRQVNEENGWLDYLAYTYDGLALTHEKLENIDSAIFFYKKFYALKDSMIGTQVQSRIHEMERINESQKKDIALLKQKTLTLYQKQTTQNIIFASLMVLALLGVWMVQLYQKGRRARLQLQENRQSLRELAKLLEAKNAELRDLKSRSDEVTGTVYKDDFLNEVNIYAHRILTDADWHTFKVLFDKAYPNYLIKIRRSFPDISEAEERMFIFIKLRLSNKESANIIGVQPETIKKTRSRLRKRLGLVQSESLNKFVLDFGY